VFKKKTKFANANTSDGMYLEHLFVQDYRNIGQLDLDFLPGLNCFTGHNGMGKTNILDAVYCLSFCRSSLSQSDALTVRHGAQGFQLQGTYCLPDGNRTVVGCVSKTGGRKRMMRDRKEYQKFSDHIGFVPLVMMTPQDTDLILGGSEGRRRFMDMVISQYDREYLNCLIKYGKALSQRNSLLKMDPMPDNEMFLMWEQAMDESGRQIYGKRKLLVEKLVPYFNEVHSSIAPGLETVALDYVSHCDRAPLLEQLVAGRMTDRAAGYSLHGIHKDDLEMKLGDFLIRREGSQGQNKTFLVALMLAQYRLLSDVCHKKPVLLLDDIFDRLDSGRVERILSIVQDGSRFGQVFITDVDRNHIGGMLDSMGCSYRMFVVENGSVL